MRVMVLLGCLLSGPLAAEATAPTKRVLLIANYLLAHNQDYLAAILAGNDSPALVLSLAKDAHASAAHNWHHRVGAELIATGTTGRRIRDKRLAKTFPGARPDTVILQVDPRWDGRRKAIKDLEQMREAVVGYAELCRAHGVEFFVCMTPGRQMLSKKKHGRKHEPKRPPLTEADYAQDRERRLAALRTLIAAARCDAIDTAAAYQILRQRHPAVDLHPPRAPWDGHLSFRDHYFTSLCMAAAILEAEPGPAREQVDRVLAHWLQRKLGRDRQLADATDRERGWITVPPAVDAQLRAAAVVAVRPASGEVRSQEK